MLRQFVRRFSSFQPAPQGRFNILSTWGRLKQAVRAPVKHLKRNIEPAGVDYNPMTQTTQEAFDEVSQEWQALLVNNPYDVNIMNTLEAVTQMNFGTVDNPHVIFTSEAPFRYVICTGQPNEDDYEGHEALVFMLREGPMQRCPSCGQVWKLVRLRNEFSPEMDYYLSNFMPYDLQEMGEMDHTINLSVIRMMKDSYEHTAFETPSNTVYTLVNSDEHDRILTDPAYRLDRIRKTEEKFKVYVGSLQKIEADWERTNGPLPRWPMNKVDYETLIEVEKAIRKMDRLFNRVEKFKLRRYIDRDNHERREKRMLERARARWEGNYTIFSGGLTEEEAQYRDYFETDLENFPENEALEEKLDEAEVLSHPDYKLDRYDFQELYTKNPEEDHSSIAEQKAFRFKYRMAADSIENYARRQKRVVQRSIARLSQDNFTEIQRELNTAIANGDRNTEEALSKRYYEIVAREGAQQYKDYYESDGEEELKVVDQLVTADKGVFLDAFENYLLPKMDNKSYATIPKREWNPAFGFWRNVVNEVHDYRSLVVPRANTLSNVGEALSLSSFTKEQMIEAKNADAQKIENKKQ